MRKDFFNNKNVIITGASNGLGKELALQFSQKGAYLVAIARTGHRLEELRKMINSAGGKNKIETHVCDVADEEKLKSLLEEIIGRLGKIDIAILNAGIKYTDSEVFSLEKIVGTFKVNFLGVLYCLDVLLPAMDQNGFGQIVFISSLGGYHGMARSSGYNASKAALSIFAESLRMDLMAKNSKIKVTVVKPGFIDTSMTHNLSRRMFPTKKERAAKIILKAIAKEKEEISFPKFLVAPSIMLSLLPKKLEAYVCNRLKSSISL